MDIERMKKFLSDGIEAGNKVKAVREAIKTYKTQKQDMYDDTSEILKPSIEVQKKVKKTIDKKQDELIQKIQENKETVDRKQDQVINQLRDNQNELIKSVDVLSEIMSNKGDQSMIEKWLSDIPSQADISEFVGEDIEEGPEEETEEGQEEEESIFNNTDKQIIKKHGFDPTFKNIPDESSIKKR